MAQLNLDWFAGDGTLPSGPLSMDNYTLPPVIGAEIVDASSRALILKLGHGTMWLVGDNLTYDANQQLNGGVITRVAVRDDDGTLTEYQLDGIHVTAQEAWGLIGKQLAPYFEAWFGGADNMTGGAYGDLLRGFAGDDSIIGALGADTIFGGAGNDTIASQASPSQTITDTSDSYLRGDEGNDVIYGAQGFDDINGNMGDDTASGLGGADWVVGGKDQDKLSGDAGDDIVYGNLGSDTCDGGDGADIVRGGQDNDIVLGGAGNDWLSGDRGDDTVTGGAGADVFHSFGDAGIDRITDFNRGEGDRLVLDPGSTYSVAQSGADVVVSIGDGAQVVLVGVQMSTLTGDWISIV